MHNESRNNHGVTVFNARNRCSYIFIFQNTFKRSCIGIRRRRSIKISPGTESQQGLKHYTLKSKLSLAYYKRICSQKPYRLYILKTLDMDLYMYYQLGEIQNQTGLTHVSRYNLTICQNENDLEEDKVMTSSKKYNFGTE